jgi:CelD/BcsL family acetyltransferase involved in cellulose biosynthesis
MTAVYSHRLVTDPADLDPAINPTLKRAWDNLAASTRNPLLAFDWFYSCATTIHADDALSVIVVYEDEDVRAIAPLVAVVHAGNRRLEILGTKNLYEPCGLLYSSTESLAYLMRVARSQGLPLCLLRIPTDRQSHDIASLWGPWQGLKIVRDSAPAAYLELGDSWEDLMASLSSNRRYDFKRKRKRAEEIGPVTVEDIRPGKADFPRYFAKAVAIEHASWKGENGSSLQANAGLRHFFEVYLQAACDRGECRFFFLRVGDEAVAMQIAIETYEACWVLKQGYMEDYARLSPGVQLAHYSLRCCIESGLQRFEFLGSEEGWQSSWPIERHALGMLLLIPYSVAGFRELYNAALSVMRRR